MREWGWKEGETGEGVDARKDRRKRTRTKENARKREVVPRKKMSIRAREYCKYTVCGTHSYSNLGGTAGHVACQELLLQHNGVGYETMKDLATIVMQVHSPANAALIMP